MTLRGSKALDASPAIRERSCGCLFCCERFALSGSHGGRQNGQGDRQRQDGATSQGTGCYELPSRLKVWKALDPTALEEAHDRLVDVVRMTRLPKVPPASKARCAETMSATGVTESTTGLTDPISTSLERARSSSPVGGFCTKRMRRPPKTAEPM